MRLALLGADDQMLAVARAAAASGEHSIILAVELGPYEAKVQSLAAGIETSNDWIDAVDLDTIDAVLVAAHEPATRIEQLRLLIQIEMPVLVSHPLSLSMLECYELDMIRRETKSTVLPYLPARWHPSIAALRAPTPAPQSDLGGVEQVLIERFMNDRTRDAVLRHFARDVDLLQAVAGEATRLHALGSAAAQAGAGPYGNITAQMTCAEGIVARWSVAPLEDQAGARLTLVSSLGKSVLWMPDDGSPWRVETRRGRESNVKEYHGWDPASIALGWLAAAIDGAPVEPTWSDAARTIELTETIDASLKRGRTIDLHREDFTDIGTFKGTMTSLGCGLLMGGLGIVVLAAIADSIAVHAGWHDLAAILGKWPYLLLAVLGAFLAIQFFLLIGKPREAAVTDRGAVNDRRPADDSAEPGDRREV